MYTIEKEFAFSASHQLQGLTDGHQCGRLHGHNYIVKVCLQSSVLDDRGFVVDYGDLKPFKDYIDTCVDHRHLNEVFLFQTTAENMARHFYEWCILRWPETHSVSISETPKTWAVYHP